MSSYAGVSHASQAVSRIDDYGIIGDCRAVALISRHGSIDWLCWPRIDSPSIFAALLDPEKGGHWSITVRTCGRPEHRYVPQSNVLQTEFLCETGQVVLTDLMPVSSEKFRRSNLQPDHEIIREVRCGSGEVDVNIDFRPRANYGREAVRFRSIGGLGIRFDVGRGAYWLRSSVPVEIRGDEVRATAHMREGEVIQFSLTYAEEAPAVLPALGDRVGAAIERTTRWWQEWASASRYAGPYREAVTRSALAVKLLAYSPSGAIAAAATTSLPEIVGDELNWDYRYCWLRDASLTVRALLGLGYVAEVEGFLAWLLHATRLTHPRLQVLYSVFGQITPKERELEHLAGYLGSRPVNIGNSASDQNQLDVYGEVIDAAAQYARYRGKLDRTTQKVLVQLGEYVAGHWDAVDDGIWEPRSAPQHRTHSRLLCWTALDRLLDLDEKGIVTVTPREGFRRERELIRRQIELRGWNEELRTYVSILDGSELDASLLQIPGCGFEPADSMRMRQTYRAHCERLGAGGGLLYRYERSPQEGAFGVCGFWAVEYLALGGGTLEEAHHAFRTLLKYANDLGLYGEETDPATGKVLGNFPQAFTHVGLISAALAIQEREERERYPSGQDAAMTSRPEASL